MQTYPVARPEPDLSVGHLFSRGWETFKANVGLSLAIAVVSTILTGIGGGARGGGGFSFLLSLAGLVIGGPVTAGAYYAFLRMVRGEPVEFASMFDGFKAFTKALAAYWLMVLIIVIGFILFVVPGIIAALGLLPVMFLVLDDNLGAVDTLKRAWEMTQGHKGTLVVLFLALIGLNVVGIIALFVGVFVTGTITMLIVAAAYDELAGAKAVPVARPVYPPPTGLGPQA